MNDNIQAPYITEAERDGRPEAPEIYCPICGSEAEDIYEDVNGDVVGCDVCIHAYDAYNYALERGWIEE